MTDEQIKLYRNDISNQLKEKESEIENNVSTVTVALLAFFITINEKFIPIVDSNFKVLLFISVGSLVISFSLSIVNKFLTTKYDKKIIEIIDSNNLSEEAGEKQLYDAWKDGSKVLSIIKVIIYILLIVGLVSQIFYFYINLDNKKTSTNRKIQIEITESAIDMDTLLHLSKGSLQIQVKNKYRLNEQKNNTQRKIISKDTVAIKKESR